MQYPVFSLRSFHLIKQPVPSLCISHPHGAGDGTGVGALWETVISVINFDYVLQVVRLCAKSREDVSSPSEF